MIVSYYMDLSIIIVNYDTKQLLKNCLSFVFNNQPTISFEVFVIDNGSTDGSLTMIKKEFPQVSIVKNKHNLLYSKANNQGLKKTKGVYVLILNSDVMLGKGVLDTMTTFMKTHPQCGLASCREVDQNGKTIRTGHQYHNPFVQIIELPFFVKFFRNSSILKKFHYEDWNRKSTKKVDTIPGSFMFGRLDILKKVGFFDVHMKLFFSDADLCLRVHRAGYDIYHHGHVTITHIKAETLKHFTLNEILMQSYQDMFYYYKKHFGIFWATLIFFFTKLSLLYYKVAK